MSQFSQKIAAFRRKAEARVEATFKAALQEVALDANTPTARGGRMRVDTGFLRNSLTGNIGAPPMGPSEQTEAQGDPNSALLVINGAQVNDVVFLGWTANYARPREAVDGFREGAVQKWPQFVEKAAREAKRKIR